MEATRRLRRKLEQNKLNENERQNLTSMFDDIVKAFEAQRADKYKLEDQMLQMVIAFEKTRAAFCELREKSDGIQEQNQVLANELKTLQTKYRIARDSLYEEQQLKERAQAELVEMEGTLALMKEIVFDNAGDAGIKLDASQRSRLVRACSLKRTNSVVGNTPRRPPIRKPMKSDETFDETLLDNSEVSFDETIDEDFPTNQFKTPRRGKRSIDTLKMDETNLPEASSTICTSESEGLSSIESSNKKIRCEIGSGNEMTTTVKGPAVVTVSKTQSAEIKKKSFVRPNGHAARRRQSRHHRQSAVMEEPIQEDSNEENESNDSFFTPSTNVGKIKARKILGANEAELSNEKIELEHRFISKRCVTVENCRVCLRRIKFYQSCLKCSTCRMIVHPECVSKVKESCSNPETPSRVAIVGPRRLSEFLNDQNQSPKIPPPIYLAIHQVDQKLTEEGIYRIPGAAKTLQEIKKKLLFGEVNNVKWEDIDVHTLTTFIKDFFRVQISEPVLTYRLLPQFIESAENNNIEALKKLIKKLPEANRDTLAFLVVHLQNVVTNSGKNKMQSTALARSIGPSLVGFQSTNPTPDEIKNAAQFQEEIVENLLMLPTQFYYGFIASGDISKAI